MSKKKIWFVLSSIFLIDIVLFIIGLKNSKDFFGITLNGILSLNLTVLVSVFLVQVLVSQRRRYDFLVKLLDNLIKELSDKDLLNSNNHVRASILQKSIANKLLYLSEACPAKLSKDIDYIKNEFDNLRTYYGDHNKTKSDDPYYERVKTNIGDKIVKLQLELHGFITK